MLYSKAHNCQIGTGQQKSERPVDALAVEKGELIAHNLESRDARASKKEHLRMRTRCSITQL